ncbi:hypothetical protein OKW76_08430 [Sphingomonas sp. S1-29]|uniref:hypothetical protein n=1 Tax=Sphingomonas sp. S1-29 TaxID=2991074 RepID=UPI00223ED63B|nr:hypothetical protein [Sphingomonas sp. S1-29]UZK68108.1 hypothetical protein OKW76_08430 [Sphingomonas sp. S1-29]
MSDAFHFIRAPRTERARAVFLIDEYLPGAGQPKPVGRTTVVAAAASSSPRAGFLFHSAFCCSTLLANAFELPGTAMTLKEPVVLNDLIGWRRRGAPPRDLAERLDHALLALGANVPAGEALLIKPSNVVNALAPAMLALRAGSRALLLHAPLPTFVASIASKGMWGRLWVRDLWAKLDADGMCALGFEPGDAMKQTDLQIAAMGWLAQHRLFAGMVARFPGRVATLDSAALLADPPRTVTAVADFFALGLDDAALAAIAGGKAFSRNAKSGEAFGVREREALHAGAIDANRDEIEKVVAWTRAVADSNGIALELPAALF